MTTINRQLARKADNLINECLSNPRGISSERLPIITNEPKYSDQRAIKLQDYRLILDLLVEHKVVDIKIHSDSSFYIKPIPDKTEPFMQDGGFMAISDRESKKKDLEDATLTKTRLETRLLRFKICVFWILLAISVIGGIKTIYELIVLLDNKDSKSEHKPTEQLESGQSTLHNEPANRKNLYF
jgi:mRNA-degrading endonuclease RelE of RelBE toxin-antitoxin system